MMGSEELEEIALKSERNNGGSKIKKILSYMDIPLMGAGLALTYFAMAQNMLSEDPISMSNILRLFYTGMAGGMVALTGCCIVLYNRNRGIY